MKPQFNIGDVVYAAVLEGKEESIPCPDCFGTKCLRVILGDGTEHTIDCAGCSPGGYDRPSGLIRISRYSARAKRITISGMDISETGCEYRSGCDNYQAANLFHDEAGAVARAAVLAKDREAQQLDELRRKEKPARTWAWHVHYHRRLIRDAKETIARSEAKLAVAREKSKTDDDEEVKS